MEESRRVGVVIIQPVEAPPNSIHYKAIRDYSQNLTGVADVTIQPESARPDPTEIAKHLKKAKLTDVVLAGEMPGYFKPAYTKAMAEVGNDPKNVRLASFRGHRTQVGGATEGAKGVVACAVMGVPFDLAAVPTTSAVNPATCVIGGGIAGIQAALEIADAGYKVYLIEKTETIGGHMAQFDKTFPTLDCAACILTPKMVSVGQHPNIELMVLSQVKEVQGEPGNYKLKVHRKASRVDASSCVACGDCEDFCPVTVPSQFDEGVGTRKAIYIPFPQAVPNAYFVDGEVCTWVQSDGKKCGVCVRKCTKGSIQLDAVDETVEIEVGNIIIATGYQVFDAKKIERYGYGKYPNVLTSLEFERVTNASGPTGGKVVMKKKEMNKRKKAEEWVFREDGPEPKSVAIIHCVGSRDENHNPYCSRVCCMYSLKFAHLVREKLPNAKCYEYYIDMRAFGKGYEEFYERIKREGVSVIRGRSANVDERNGQMYLKGENILDNTVLDLPVDMVILSVGLEPNADSPNVARMLGISRSKDGWFNELEYNTEPTSTERGGVFVAGVCQGPKDIPDTVAQASAVASKVLRGVVSGKGLKSRRELSLNEIEENARALAAA